ncbi:hypothetical protein [Stenotrophomonas maltophilia]|uniref:hypothetical protein n=1 Tax=Stenotrophomonas maltophilia TaxID=40324 RepID=UPI001FA77960|nr:hypothetical protein [Stenotrophomonas maltophilia]
MRERPILFNGAMVCAILAGQKTQTRRAIKDIPWRPGCNPDFSQARAFSNAGEFRIAGSQEMTTGFRCPLGKSGDRLWVRETTVNVEKHGYLGPVYLESEEGLATLQGGLAPAPDDMTEVEPHEITLRPSIHMPRSMCRLVLEITDVRVERLQAISEADARAEGVDPEMPDECVLAFERLWVSISGPSSWNSNPWVWVITFKRIEA